VGSKEDEEEDEEEDEDNEEDSVMPVGRMYFRSHFTVYEKLGGVVGLVCNVNMSFV
jgi:hypothetical protein